MSLRRFLISLLWLPLILPVPTSALEIVAVSPSTAAVGASVNVTGGPFTEKALIRLGDRTVRPEIVNSKQMTFVVPDLPAGDYLLNLQEGENLTEWPMLLRVVDPQPVIVTLDPLRVDVCDADANRRITVTGHSFVKGAGLLVDGAQLPAEQTSSNQIEFLLPNLKAGMHRVEIVNPDGNRSLPFAVMINGIPEILSVGFGEDRVVSYALEIHGRNFSANADLLVNGVSVKAAISSTGKRGGGRDSVIFVDCQTLIYTRYPVTREPSQLALTVFVPNADRSEPFYVAAP
jgi:IPT/TIG domain